MLFPTRGDEYRVEGGIAEQIAIIFVDRRFFAARLLHLFGRLRAPVRIDVAYRPDVRVFERQHGVQQRFSALPQTDYADVYFLHICSPLPFFYIIASPRRYGNGKIFSGYRLFLSFSS